MIHAALPSAVSTRTTKALIGRTQAAEWRERNRAHFDVLDDAGAYSDSDARKRRRAKGSPVCARCGEILRRDA